MSDTLELLSKRVSLRVAAKMAHKSERYIRVKLIDAGHLRAWRAGGEKKPRFFVMPDEIGPAISRATAYVPPVVTRPKASSSRPAIPASHPDVRF